MTADGVPGPGPESQQVAEIRQMVREIQATHKAMRQRSLVATVLILALILGFAFATYLKLKTNLAQEKLAAAAAARMPLLMPQLQEPLNQTLKGVVPFYVDMGRQRFGELGPKLDARVKAEADALGTNLEKKLTEQLQQFFHVLDVHAKAQLLKNFPALAGDGATTVGAKMHEVLTQEADKLTRQAHEIYGKESKRITDALAKFPVPDVRQTDLESLNRQLLHNLLMYADYEMVLKDSTAVQTQKVSR